MGVFALYFFLACKGQWTFKQHPERDHEHQKQHPRRRVLLSYLPLPRLGVGTVRE